VQKILIILLGGFSLIFGGSTIFAYHNSPLYSQLPIRNSQSILPCPECGCWSRWLESQNRSYLDKFALLPRKEKILTVCDYQIFLTSIQVLPDTFELLIYAQNPQTRKPYIKSKNISIYRQISRPNQVSVNSSASPQAITGSLPVLNIKDDNLVSDIRYVNPEPSDYWVRVTLEDESGCALIGETCFVLGSPSPNLVYIVIFGGLIVSILIIVLYLRRKHRIIS